jgi:hypothetical protein
MVQIKEKQVYHGSFRMAVHEAGKPMRDYADHNLIVGGAKGVMAHLIGGDFDGRFITDIACGTSSTAVDDTDTVIADEFVKPISEVSFPENDQVLFGWHLTPAENNGMIIREFGLFTEDHTLFARIVLDEPVKKTTQIGIDVEWIIAFEKEEE